MPEPDLNSFFRGFAGGSVARANSGGGGRTPLQFLGDVFEGVALSDEKTVNNLVNLARRDQAQAATQLALSTQAIRAQQASFEARLNAATFDAQVQELASQNKQRALTIERLEQQARARTLDADKMEDYTRQFETLMAAGNPLEARLLTPPTLENVENIRQVSELQQLAEQDPLFSQQQVRAQTLEAIPRQLVGKRFLEENQLSGTVDKEGRVSINVPKPDIAAGIRPSEDIVDELGKVTRQLETAEGDTKTALEAQRDKLTQELNGLIPEVSRQLEATILDLLNTNQP